MIYSGKSVWYSAQRKKLFLTIQLSDFNFFEQCAESQTYLKDPYYCIS